VETQGDAALITGAARRIGRAIAIELARNGCDIAVHYNTSRTEAEETARMVRELGRQATIFQADLEDAEAAAALPQRAVEALGRLNVLVNNASSFASMTVDAFSRDAWDRTLALNLTAPMILAHAAHPHLRAGGRGRIVNLTDSCANRPWPDYLAYCVSKAGLSALTQTLAKAMAPEVRVNAVAPGAALFPEDFDEGKIKDVIRRVPAHRSGQPEDVAAAVRFFVVDCDYMTGSVLAVDGGRNIAW